MSTVSPFRRRLLSSIKPKVPNYLCFTALEDTVFTFTIAQQIDAIDCEYIEYSLDEGVSWVRTNNVTNQAVTITTPTILDGNKVLWRGIGYKYSNGNYHSIFSSSGNYKVGGNIASLIYGKNFTNATEYRRRYATNHSSNRSIFQNLFYNCTTLLDASELILPNIGFNYNAASFYGMFRGCTNLVDASFELPTIISERNIDNQGQYQQMFFGCSSLLYPPIFKMTELNTNQCMDMFYDCSSLVIAPDLSSITTTTPNCFYEMFYGCTSLVQATSNLSSTKLSSSCYYRMFKGCTSLSKVMEILPATVLESGCYWEMFQGCTSLEKAPELPALTLVSNCYVSMFNRCTSLKYIKMMATEITVPSNNPISSWVTNVSNDGTFVRNPNATWWVIGQSGIPNGWLLEDGTEQSDEVIVFEDAEAKRVITSRYGGVIPDATYSSHWPIRIKGKVDGEITYRQASHIASITEAFYNNTELIKFHEFQYFTAIDGSGSRWFRNCKTLQEITLPNKDNLAIADSAFYQCRDITVFNNWDKVTVLNNNCLGYTTGNYNTLVANLDFTKIKRWGGSVIIGNNEIISLYLPSVRRTNDFYGLGNCILIDIGHDIPIEFGTLLFWGWAAHECNLVFRCPAVIKTNWSGMDMHQNATGCIFNLYVYEKYHNDYVNDAYWSTADNIYKIGGAEWVTQFGSLNEWADYPNGQAPNVDLTESEVEYVRPLVNTAFDTKLTPTANTHTVVRGRFADLTNTEFAGTYHPTTQRYHMGCYGSKFCFGCGNKILQVANWDTNIHTFELYGNGTCVLDGTEYSIGATLGSAATTISLFARHGSGTSYAYTTSFELHSAKIYEGTTLVKDYVPYRYRGNVYLKEKVSNKLEWVGYGDNFEIGNDVNS